MATYTSNYGWTKPSGSDNVDISVLNDNLDDQDSTIHDAFLNMAPPFSESSTYAVDDIVLYGTGLYKCHTAVVTPGSWTGSTNWQVYKLSEGGSGGGTSNYNQLTNKPQINSVELSGNKTSAQLGLMASDGVVANPTGQTTGTLTALEVGGTKYAVPSGGTSDYTALTNKPSVNGVTLSGNKTTSDLGISYNDLTNKPSLATVATSGSYNDLSNKPTIPTSAGDISYDNTDSGLTATDVQGAVDKLALSQMNPLSHNGIYTGRNLGTINSASEWAAFRAKYGIADKSYKGLYLGDYVKVNDGTYNADWMVGGFNTETNKGSTNIPGECVSMIPRLGNGCGTSYMNSTNVTTGGYKDSYMNTTKLPDVATKLTTIFGSNLVTRDILVSKTVTDGHVSDWEWISCKCSLMTSVQVYGSLSFENTGGTYFAGYNIGEGCEKLPVFNFINPVQFARSYFWLRGVSSASNFCSVGDYGNANDNGASRVFGVRPLICLS